MGRDAKYWAIGPLPPSIPQVMQGCRTQGACDKTSLVSLSTCTAITTQLEKLAEQGPNLRTLGGSFMRSRRIRIDPGLPRYQAKTGSKIEPKLEMVSRFNTWLESQQYKFNTRRHYCKIAREGLYVLWAEALPPRCAVGISEFLRDTSTSRWTAATFRAYLSALRFFFEFLYLGGVVDSIAPRFVRGPVKVRTLPKVLTQDHSLRHII